MCFLQLLGVPGGTIHLARLSKLLRSVACSLSSARCDVILYVAGDLPVLQGVSQVRLVDLKLHLYIAILVGGRLVPARQARGSHVVHVVDGGVDRDIGPGLHRLTNHPCVEELGGPNKVALEGDGVAVHVVRQRCEYLIPQVALVVEHQPCGDRLVDPLPHVAFKKVRHVVLDAADLGASLRRHVDCVLLRVEP